jgi:hypothetical protein
MYRQSRRKIPVSLPQCSLWFIVLEVAELRHKIRKEFVQALKIKRKDHVQGRRNSIKGNLKGPEEQNHDEAVFHVVLHTYESEPLTSTD